MPPAPAPVRFAILIAIVICAAGATLALANLFFDFRNGSALWMAGILVIGLVARLAWTR